MNLERKNASCRQGGEAGSLSVWRLLLLMVGLKGQKETDDTQLAAVPKDIVVLVRQEFHLYMECWQWALREPYSVDGVSLHAPVSYHERWHPEGHCLSDATSCAVGCFGADGSVVAI